MKKVILALAIVSVSFAACNEGEKKEETPATETVTPTVDTNATVAPAAHDSLTAPVADTTKK
jgi:hypothetical protein